jgi:hypothetical protein
MAISSVSIEYVEKRVNHILPSDLIFAIESRKSPLYTYTTVCL